MKLTRIGICIMICLCLVTCSALGDTESPLKVENGMLQPVFAVSDALAEDYTNEDSDILRFCVWVETDHDTDMDGKADLVKVFLQVPRAAAEGKYKAAAIYDPTPYSAGTVEEYATSAEPMYVEEPFDYSQLENPGEKRTPAGKMTTLEAAAQADPTQWNYPVPKSEATGFNNTQSYDYFLMRGYAVVIACGIGTYGSEGFELCGTHLERDSHKNVIEWLTGNRIAFTDRTSNVEISADWSSGSVAMTGTSYGGTIPFEVAVTGVEGLKTIIPFAGISNWYDYTNAQGVTIVNDAHYADSLAVYNCGGTFLDAEWDQPNPKYGSWLWQISRDQDITNGDYAPIYAALDYTTDEENHTACSALVVQGMNDYNVNARQAYMMVQTFVKAGQTVKVVLHQDGHNSLDGLSVNGQVWEEIMNKWLSHYLYGVDNDAEAMPAVLAQSNVDGRFQAYDTWLDYEKTDAKAQFTTPESTFTAEGLAKYTMDYQEQTQNNLTVEDQENFYQRLPEALASVYTLDVPANTTICGMPEVHVTLTSPHEDLDGMMISAILMDVSDKGTFPAYQVKTEMNSILTSHSTDEKWMMGPEEDDMLPMKEFDQVQMPAKCVTFGWTDLRNPGMGPNSYEYVFQEEGREPGKAYDYTFYMVPTVYTLAEGHHLELRLMTWDPFRVFLDEGFDLDASQDAEILDCNYYVTVNNQTMKVLLPVAK